MHLFQNVALETHSNRQAEQLKNEQARHLHALLHQNHISGWMPVHGLPHSLRESSQRQLIIGTHEMFLHTESMDIW